MTTTFKKKFSIEIEKADRKLGLVFGKVIVCTKRGKPYFDTQGDHCPDETMLDVATEFMKSTQGVDGMDVMHDDEPAGNVVFLFPLTADIAKQFDIKSDWTGLMTAVRPGSEEIWKRIEKGELTAFSIGGVRGVDEVVEPDDDEKETT